MICFWSQSTHVPLCFFCLLRCSRQWLCGFRGCLWTAFVWRVGLRLLDGNKQGKGIRARFLFSILSIFFLENKPCFSKCLGMFCFLTFDLSDQLAGIAVKPVMEILVLISFAEWFGVMMYIGANWLWYPTGGGDFFGIPVAKNPKFQATAWTLWLRQASNKKRCQRLCRL